MNKGAVVDCHNRSPVAWGIVYNRTAKVGRTFAYHNHKTFTVIFNSKNSLARLYFKGRNKRTGAPIDVLRMSTTSVSFQTFSTLRTCIGEKYFDIVTVALRSVSALFYVNSYEI